MATTLNGNVGFVRLPSSRLDYFDCIYSLSVILSLPEVTGWDFSISSSCLLLVSGLGRAL